MEYLLISYYFSSKDGTPGFGHVGFCMPILDIERVIRNIKAQDSCLTVVIISINRLSKEEFCLWEKQQEVKNELK